MPALGEADISRFRRMSADEPTGSTLSKAHGSSFAFTLRKTASQQRLLQVPHEKHFVEIVRVVRNSKSRRG